MRSHELPDGSCNILAMLVGRGTLAMQRWGLKVDRAGQPYIRTQRGKTYMVEPNRGFEEQQAEYTQACLEAEGPGQSIHFLGEGEITSLDPEPEPLGELECKHLPALAKIRDLLSEEDFCNIVSSILEALGSVPMEERGVPTPGPHEYHLERKRVAPQR